MIKEPAILKDKEIKVYEVVFRNTGTQPLYVDLFDSLNVKDPIVVGNDANSYTEQSPVVLFNATSRDSVLNKNLLYRIAGADIAYTNQSAPNDALLYTAAGVVNSMSSDNDNRLFLCLTGGDTIEIVDISGGFLAADFSTGLGSAPTLVRADVLRNLIYVYVSATNQIKIYDMTTYVLVSTQALLPMGAVLDMEICGSNLFIINDANVQTLDLSSYATAIVDTVVLPLVLSDVAFIPNKNIVAVTVSTLAGGEIRYYNIDGTSIQTTVLPAHPVRVIPNEDYTEIDVLTYDSFTLQSSIITVTDASYAINGFDNQYILTANPSPILFAYLNNKFTVAGLADYMYVVRASNIVFENKECYDFFNNAKQANRLVVFELGISATTAEQLIHTVAIPEKHPNGQSYTRIVQPIVELNQHSFRDDIVKIPTKNRKIVFDAKMKIKAYKVNAGERVSFELFYKEFHIWEIIKYDSIEKFISMKDV